MGQPASRRSFGRAAGLSDEKTEPKVHRALLLILCAMLACGGGAMAQSYPNRPITLIVPYGAGGPLDTLTRMFSDKMRVPLGRSLVIENVTGASGTVGVDRAARSAPDGYTVSVGNWPTHVVNGATFTLP